MKPFFLFLLVTLGAGLASRAHDPYEITARATLKTNSMELRLIFDARAVEKFVADTESRPQLRSTGALEVEKARVSKVLARLVQVRSAEKPLMSLVTNVSAKAEEHIDCVLTFARPAAGQLEFDASDLKKLSGEEPYGVVLTVIDLPNNEVLGQQVLSAANPVFRVSVREASSWMKRSSRP